MANPQEHNTVLTHSLGNNISTDRGRFIVMCLMLGIIVTVTFISGRTGTFLIDDYSAIINNRTIHDFSLWRVLKCERDIIPSGRPLTNLSYAISYYFSGENPKPYLLTNLVQQIIVAWLMLLMLRRLLPTLLTRYPQSQKYHDWLALCLTLWWIVHPLQTEPTLYITQRSDQYANIAMILACYALLRHHQASNHGRGWMIMMFASSVVGMLFKQNVWALPILLLLLDRATLAGNFKKTWQYRGIAHLLNNLTCGAILIAILIYDPYSKCTGTGHGLSSWDYLLTQSQILIWYARNFFWPTGLCLYYEWPFVHDILAVWPEFLTLGAIFCFACYSLYRFPRIGAALFSAFMILAPTSSIFPHLACAANDRRFVQPAALILLILTMAVVNLLLRCKRTRQLAIPITCAILLLATAMILPITARLSVCFGNPTVLWEHTRHQACAPQGSWEHLGSHYFDIGQYAPAWQCFNNVLDMEPDYNIAKLHLAKVYLQFDNLDQAIEILKPIQNVPSIDYDVQMLLGAIYKSKKDYPNAITYFQKACHTQPDQINASLNLARIYVLTEQFTKALDVLKPLLNRPYVTYDLYQDLGYVYSQLGQLKPAQQAYQRYLKHVPDDAKVLNSMGVVQAKLGRLKQAGGYFARALALDPTLTQASDNLNRVRAMLIPSISQPTPDGE